MSNLEVNIFFKLPKDILLEIFHQLPPKDVVKNSIVYKDWYKINQTWRDINNFIKLNYSKLDKTQKKYLFSSRAIKDIANGKMKIEDIFTYALNNLKNYQYDALKFGCSYLEAKNIKAHQVMLMQQGQSFEEATSPNNKLNISASTSLKSRKTKRKQEDAQEIAASPPKRRR